MRWSALCIVLWLSALAFGQGATTTRPAERPRETEAPVNDPTQAGAELEMALQRSGAATTATAAFRPPQVLFRGFIAVERREPEALIEVAEFVHIVREGSEFIVNPANGPVLRGRVEKMGAEGANVVFTLVQDKPIANQ